MFSISLRDDTCVPKLKTFRICGNCLYEGGLGGIIFIGSVYQKLSFMHICIVSCLQALPGLFVKSNNFSQLVIHPVIGRFTKMLDALVRGIPFNLDLSYRPCLGVKV